MQNYFEKRNRTFLSFKKIRNKKRKKAAEPKYRERIRLICDEGSFVERYKDLETDNPLSFRGYRAKLEKVQKESGLNDGVITGSARVYGVKVFLAIMDTSFMMSSMGVVAGEKITRIAEDALEEKRPLIIFAASGGARMQEGMLSLMQMAKTAAVMGKLKEEGVLSIVFLTHPTTGGVSASFASLGDYIFAEPGALIGFAGPRVIEQTIGEKLPKGFQRAAFQQQHGFVDGVIEKEEERQLIRKLLVIHKAGCTNA